MSKQILNSIKIGLLGPLFVFIILLFCQINLVVNLIIVIVFGFFNIMFSVLTQVFVNRQVANRRQKQDDNNMV